MLREEDYVTLTDGIRRPKLGVLKKLGIDYKGFQDKSLVVTSTEDLLRTSVAPVQSLWANFLYDDSIVLLAGDPGVGKTTFAYNLAIHGALGQAFCGIEYPRPLRVLYGDLETGIALRQTKVNMIADGKPVPNLWWISDVDLEKDSTELLFNILTNKIDLVIVDTISEAFRTQKEDDNAEANRQFRIIKRLRDQGKCTVLLMHHTGKQAQSKGVYSPRGASARANGPDVVLTLCFTSEEVIRLQKEKDRIGGGKDKLYLKRAGEDMFELVNYGEELELPLIIRAQPFIMKLISEGTCTRGEIITRCGENGITRTTADRALESMVRSGKLKRPRQGVYSQAST